ncbi:hypothetical protein [Salinicoccus carnicancri]|uniref:hypothetical protein n=1 Tax=Salinicoccus carnicancri TaxID=558170 RepID=UPI00030468BC|nr:hypothetical protein [Salinicoccus carnicancri]
MEILPLLIFLGGIIYSAIASQKNKDKKEQRNIDPGKLNNPNKRSNRPSASGRQESSKGFFEQVKGELERSFGTFDENTDSQQRQSQSENMGSHPENQSPAGSQKSKQERTRSDRPFGRSLEKKARESRTGSKAMDYYEDKLPADRSKPKERAQKAKDYAYAEGVDRSEAAKRVKDSGRESAERSRYSLDEDDLFGVSAGKPDREKGQSEPALSRGDLSFDRKAVLNGIIFSEILGKPKSKR